MKLFTYAILNCRIFSFKSHPILSHLFLAIENGKFDILNRIESQWTQIYSSYFALKMRVQLSFGGKSWDNPVEENK